MKHKKIEVFSRDAYDPIGSIPKKKYKIEVREVDSITEAIKEFGSMKGVIKVLNQRLESHGIQAFRNAMHSGESVRKARKLAKNSKVELFRNRKREHNILDGITTDKILAMTPDDMQKLVKNLTGE